MKPMHTGLALGGLLVAVHIAWSLVVALGWGQPTIDFVFDIHMLDTGVTVEKFDLTKAVELIVVVGLSGFVLGQVFARIWNKVK